MLLVELDHMFRAPVVSPRKGSDGAKIHWSFLGLPKPLLCFDLRVMARSHHAELGPDTLRNHLDFISVYMVLFTPDLVIRVRSGLE